MLYNKHVTFLLPAAPDRIDDERQSSETPWSQITCNIEYPYLRAEEAQSSQSSVLMSPTFAPAEDVGMVSS